MRASASVTDRAVSYALIGGVASSLVSIFVSNLLFATSILLWVVTCCRSRRFFLQRPPFATFLLALVVAVLISIVFSTNVLASSLYLMKLIKFFYIFLIFTYFTRRQIEWTFRAVLLALGVSAVYGIGQYYWLMEVHWMNRIHGFMGNWMTFSGQLMLGLVALTAYLLFDQFPFTRNVEEQHVPEEDKALTRRTESRGQTRGYLRWLWLALLLILVITLVLTLTRNAWLGSLVGLLVIVAFRRRLWVVGAAAAVVVVFLFLPSAFQQRFYSAFDPEDMTTRVRLELLTTGGRMIAAHPLTGVGPRRVRDMSRQYRTSDEFPEWIYQHLHNDVVQIAAEMGLLTLAVWVALWVRVFRDLLRLMREARWASDPLLFRFSAGGVGVLSSFLCAGLFEYNFGDSEVLILLLFFITAPYVVSRRRETVA